MIQSCGFACTYGGMCITKIIRLLFIQVWFRWQVKYILIITVLLILNWPPIITVCHSISICTINTHTHLCSIFSLYTSHKFIVWIAYIWSWLVFFCTRIVFRSMKKRKIAKILDACLKLSRIQLTPPSTHLYHFIICKM